jgi:hypothetical protein
MAILLVLMPARTKACLRSDALAALARLGVTRVALVHDERSTGVVVEGWAFDPIGSSEAVIAAVSGSSRRARTLQPLMEMTLAQGDE